MHAPKICGFPLFGASLLIHFELFHKALSYKVHFANWLSFLDVYIFSYTWKNLLPCTHKSIHVVEQERAWNGSAPLGWLCPLSGIRVPRRNFLRCEIQAASFQERSTAFLQGLCEFGVSCRAVLLKLPVVTDQVSKCPMHCKPIVL